ncbi:hypothetical protein SAMN04488003_101329 [Loktanella fryxellensis]|uniref:Uncharacterized protein n=1 Tax=Loktanella fryxellensis TaxID=245187 RepID=A0A1H7YUW9_9RHOB|nr:hypothetical protein [Loktanella fryxellensis]SEM50032.1 hypothetical protein SAMN04488003_101329 [Loktanella fryxellensis]
MTTGQDVGAIAQSAAKLPMDAITLIGLFTGPQGDSALIRKPDGRVVHLARGETTDRLTLLDVTDQVAAVRDGRGTVFSLAMPPQT